MKHLKHKTKKIVTVAISAPIILSSFLFLPAYAANPNTFSVSPAETTTTSVSPTITNSSKLPTAQRIANLKARATTEIQNRINLLNDVIKKVSANKKLTALEQSTAITDIQAQITSLTALQAKIQADTDFKTLQADAKSIVDGFRIYVFYVVKMNIMIASEAMSETASRLNDLASKINASIQKNQANGKDVSLETGQYNDMLLQLNNATKLYSQAESSVANLTVAGYPNNKATLIAARDSVKQALDDLRNAVKDAKLITSELKALNTGSSTSVTVTTSPTMTEKQ